MSRYFYNRCAELLGTEHYYVNSEPIQKINWRTGEFYTPATRATRWGGRGAGNGRFPGFGMIRLFGDTVQINLYHPKKIYIVIEGREQALAFLNKELKHEKEATS